jgi:hypothetical protein
VFPFDLSGGSIVLEGFFGNILRSKPGSTLEVEERNSKRTNGYVVGWNCMGLSGWDSWKNRAENESIEGNVQTMESNEGIY